MGKVTAIVAELDKLKESDLKPYPMAQAREKLLIDALMAMAEECGVNLQWPVSIDSRGELSIIALKEGETYPKLGCGSYGEKFASWLTKHNPRTGMYPTAIMIAENGWCYMNHFDVEKMVRAFAAEDEA